jgi:hypothetical protein
VRYLRGLAIVLCLVGCRRDGATVAVVDAAPPAASASATAMTSSSAVASASGVPKQPELRCEVEISGRVTPPGDAKHSPDTYVYVAEGDCLANDAKMLGRARAVAGGKFFTEVFSSWGADLTVCAAVEATPAAPAATETPARRPMSARPAHARGRIR